MLKRIKSACTIILVSLFLASAAITVFAESLETSGDLLIYDVAHLFGGQRVFELDWAAYYIYVLEDGTIALFLYDEEGNQLAMGKYFPCPNDGIIGERSEAPATWTDIRHVSPDIWNSHAGSKRNPILRVEHDIAVQHGSAWFTRIWITLFACDNLPGGVRIWGADRGRQIYNRHMSWMHVQAAETPVNAYRFDWAVDSMGRISQQQHWSSVY